MACAVAVGPMPPRPGHAPSSPSPQPTLAPCRRRGPGASPPRICDAGGPCRRRPAPRHRRPAAAPLPPPWIHAAGAGPCSRRRLPGPGPGSAPPPGPRTGVAPRGRCRPVPPRRPRRRPALDPYRHAAFDSRRSVNISSGFRCYTVDQVGTHHQVLEDSERWNGVCRKAHL